MSCYCGKTRKRPNFGIHFLDAFDERNSRFITVPYSKQTCFYEHRPRSAGMFLMSYFSDLAEQGPIPENIPCLKNRRCGFAFKIVKPSKTAKDQWKPVKKKRGKPAESDLRNILTATNLTVRKMRIPSVHESLDALRHIGQRPR